MVSIESTGTVQGYEDYHNDILFKGKLIGSCHFDKKQGLYVAMIDGCKKKVYASHLMGIEIGVLDKMLKENPNGRH